MLRQPRKWRPLATSCKPADHFADIFGVKMTPYPLTLDQLYLLSESYSAGFHLSLK